MWDTPRERGAPAEQPAVEAAKGCTSQVEKGTGQQTSRFFERPTQARIPRSHPLAHFPLLSLHLWHPATRHAVCGQSSSQRVILLWLGSSSKAKADPLAIALCVVGAALFRSLVVACAGLPHLGASFPTVRKYADRQAGSGSPVGLCHVFGVDQFPRSFCVSAIAAAVLTPFD